MDHLSRVLTNVNVNMVIHFLYLTCGNKEKLNYIVNLYVLHCYSNSLFFKHVCSGFFYYMFKMTFKSRWNWLFHSFCIIYVNIIHVTIIN